MTKSNSSLELMALVEHEGARIALSPMLSLAFAREQSSAKWASDCTTLLIGLALSAGSGFVLTWLALG